MNIKKLAVTLLATTVMPLAHAAECDVQVNAVRFALNGDYFAEPMINRFCTEPSSIKHKKPDFGEEVCKKLRAKLDDADTKFEKSDFKGAEKKITDFRKAVDSLFLRDKPIMVDPYDYGYINAELEKAEACADALTPDK